VRHPAGYAVSTGRGLVILDLGFGNLRQLARAGLDPARVRAAFFSHLHPDHVGDLAALLFFFNYERRPVSREVRLFGPVGFKAFLRRLTAAHRPWLAPRGYRLEARDLPSGARVLGPGWVAAARSVPHSSPCLAYRFSDGRRSLVYSGDTGYSAGLAAFAAGSDLLVLECSAPDRSPHPGVHLTVSEALKLARISNCRNVVFSHLGEEAGAGLKRSRKWRKGYLLARDGMELSL
jgi:ribonuclease BN (tRNA processing enzyme)